MSAPYPGEGRAWELLAAADPARIRERAAAAPDPGNGGFLVPSFGRTFRVRPSDRLVAGLDPAGEEMLRRHGQFLRLSLLWYLARASAARPSGVLVRPADLPGGGIFTKGTHVLPLAELAERYARQPAAFRAAAAALGGRAEAYGDAAALLPALPKVPATVILWTADDEFPARADLLFDASAPRHLPTDILWSVAQLSVLSLLQPDP